jgi:hypothetical protein
MNNRQNVTNVFNRQSPDLGPGYFQPQQQVYGGYPSAPSPFGSNNQLYNPGYVMNGYASPNSEYFPGYNGTYLGANQNFNYNNMGVPNQPMADAPWNRTMNIPFNPQVKNGPEGFYPGSGAYLGGATFTRGPQSCIAMTGERITVQSLPGTQPEGKLKSRRRESNHGCCAGQIAQTSTSKSAVSSRDNAHDNS